MRHEGSVVQHERTVVNFRLVEQELLVGGRFFSFRNVRNTSRGDLGGLGGVGVMACSIFLSACARNGLLGGSPVNGVPQEQWPLAPGFCNSASTG